MGRTEGSMVLLAVFVSRFEASMVAAMLRGYGLLVSLDGEAHASVAYYSLALGGHRLRVASMDYDAASDILRECGVERREYVHPRPTGALRLLLMALAGFWTSVAAFSVFLGNASIATFLEIPLAVYTVPVDPKGKPDYFLAPAGS